MLVNPYYVSGGGGSGGYVLDGLTHHIVNKNNSTVQKYGLDPGIPLSSSGLTIELHYRPDSADQDSFCGMQYGTNPPYIVLNHGKNSSYLGENSDYALNPFIQRDDFSYTGDIVALPNLKWGTYHTYTYIIENNTLKCYYDGVKTSLEQTYSTYTFPGNNISLMNRYNISNRQTRGAWFDLRIYNRVLTASEISQNYREDVKRYDPI